MINKLLFLLLFNLFFIQLSSQEIKKASSYKDLKQKIKKMTLEEDESRFEKIQKFIAYAKLMEDPNMIWQGYDLARLYGRPELDTVYCDSMIFIAKTTLDSSKIADSYLAKALHRDTDYKYKAALDELNNAERYLKNSKNKLVQYSIYYSIGLIYYEVGDNENAVKYLKKSADFFSNNHPITEDTDYRLYYILSLDKYVLIKAKQRKDSIVKKYNEKLREFIDKENFNYKKHLPTFNYGINDYYQARYDSSIINLKKALEESLPNSGHHLTEHYYIGLSYWEKGLKKEALPYFMYIDSIYSINGKLPKEFHSVYELLIKHMQENNEIEKQLTYVNKLLALNKGFEKDYKKIIPQLERGYSIKSLESEKIRLESLIAQNKKNKTLVIGFSLLIISLLLIWGIRTFKRNKVLNMQFHKLEADLEEHKAQLENVKKEHQDLIDKKNVKNEIAEKIKSVNYKSIAEKLGMSEEAYKLISNFLQEFESNKLYLDKDIDLSYLSQKIGTNPNYLSKVINHQKNMNFSAYLHNLRIFNATENLYYGKSKNLSIMEIAESNGYNSKKTFEKEFKKINGLSFTQFVKRIKK